MGKIYKFDEILNDLMNGETPVSIFLGPGQSVSGKIAHNGTDFIEVADCEGDSIYIPKTKIAAVGVKNDLDKDVV